MQSREDSLWESFPQAMKTREGAGRYINAFWAPFQGLPPLSHQDVYVLRACSLLVISPPAGSAAPQGGFPTDLAGINLSDWATLVQDMAAGGWPSGTATQPEQSLGPWGGKLAPTAGGSNRSRVLPLLLQSRTSLCVCGSLSVSSPYFMEPGCRADSRI